MLYHPDKQSTSNDPSSSSSSSAASRKLAAETHFNAIQNATSTLLDPSLRSVYDHFGPPGLESKWDVAAPPESKKRAGGVSPQEAEEFLLARAYDKRREKAENMVRSKADLNMSVDMRAVFLPKRFFDEKVRDKVNHGVVARLGRTRVGQLGLKSGFEVSQVARITERRRTRRRADILLDVSSSLRSLRSSLLNPSIYASLPFLK